ncbi:hypothetical protein FE257_008061 [Aspergillus nanangensis]|uniref:Acetyl-CoA synthetase-like protein n=1 Tax=Aspergillus nanangensis TaxID=2582783 RepID=A0AAD4CM69_ASPNN|nr:hypothetical protein FE257_008061 [Aspergillus nanangensis]
MSSSEVVVQSPCQIDIPAIDIVTYVFQSGTPRTRDTPQFFDADVPSRCFSLSQAELYVKRLARGLQKLGLEKGDKVLLYAGNHLFFPVLLWGVIASGCVFTAVNPAASETELEYQLRDSDARLLITHPGGVGTATAVAGRVGLPQDRIYIFEDIPGTGKAHSANSWLQLWCSPSEIQGWEWERMSSLAEAQSTTAILNYSSGTTGPPKGVEISHYNAVANSLQLIHKRSLFADTPEARGRQSRLRTTGERWLAALPMYHAYGQTYFCMSVARIGAKVFIMQKFNLSKFLLYLDIYRITFLSAVPVILVMMAKHPHPGNFNLTAIENVTTGSAPLNPEIGRTIERLYLRDGVTVKQGLGMTECTCSLTGFALDDIADPRSVGWLNANCRIKIVPVEDEAFAGSVPPGVVVGELWAAGPNVMKGYYKRPQETASSILYDNDEVRWLRTGDIGYVDSNGHVYLVDRLKELIKVKGLQVSPAELELALLAHPGVADAAVVGAKIDDAEYPRAFVVRKDPTITGRELENLVKSRFAQHKWLSGGVVFVDLIPRTASGKVMRRVLAANLQAKL